MSGEDFNPCQQELAIGNTGSTPEPTYNCPPGYMPDGNDTERCFKAMGKMNFDEASKTCENDDGDLFWFEDDSHLEILHDLTSSGKLFFGLQSKGLWDSFSHFI